MKAPPVSDQPTSTLHKWIIAYVLGNYFLVGFESDLSTVRRSTPLVSFDADNLICRTQSGRLYELDLPNVAGDVAFLLLERFKESLGLNGIDVTIALLSDPNLIYKSFLITCTDTGKLAPAESRLQRMVEQPVGWLHQLMDALAKNDVCPELLKMPLGLSGQQWRAFKKGSLTSVSMEIAFRGLLISEIFSMASESVDTRSLLDREMSALFDNSTGRIPLGVLDVHEMHELFKQYHQWLQHSAVIQSLRSQLRILKR